MSSEEKILAILDEVKNKFNGFSAGFDSLDKKYNELSGKTEENGKSIAILLERINNIPEKVEGLRISVEGLRIKSGVWGLVGGFIPPCLVLIFLILKGILNIGG